MTGSRVNTLVGERCHLKTSPLRLSLRMRNKEFLRQAKTTRIQLKSILKNNERSSLNRKEARIRKKG